MAMTLHAQQISQLKTHFMQSTTNFRNKVLTLRALFVMRNLGIPTRRWAAKKLFWLHQFVDEDLAEQAERLRMLDELAEKNELALKKHLTRVANRAAKKAEAAAPAPTPAQQGRTPWD